MKTYSVLILLFISISCSKDKKIDNNVCITTESMDNIPWFLELKKSIATCICETFIVKGTYESKTVIYIRITDPICDAINTPTLYTCDGKVIRSFTNSIEDQKELVNKVTWDSELYRCNL